MKRLMTSLAAVAVALTLTGCIDITTVVSVDKEGAGHIVQTLYMSPMLSAMDQMGDGGEEKGPSEAQLSAAAAKMGTGVRYVSHKKVMRANGAKGYRVVFAFDDVTTLKVNPMPENDDAGGGMAVGAGEPDLLTFGFAPGPNPTLTVNIPQNKADGEPDGFEDMDADLPDQPEDVAAGDDGMGDLPGAGADAGMDAMGAQMMQMFQGFRIRALVRVDGEITDSNASYVQKGSKSGVKQYVTIYDMDLGKMMNNPEQMKKLQGLQGGGVQSLAAMSEQLKDVEGLKLELQPSVKITFK